MKVLNSQEKPVGEKTQTGADKLIDDENGRRPWGRLVIEG